MLQCMGLQRDTSLRPNKSSKNKICKIILKIKWINL